jgi:hypothetical protein
VAPAPTATPSSCSWNLSERRCWPHHPSNCPPRLPGEAVAPVPWPRTTPAAECRRHRPF